MPRDQSENGNCCANISPLCPIWRQTGQTERRLFAQKCRSFGEWIDQRCLEGIIDLALIRSVDGRWLILDWKTNRVAPDKIETLRAQYRPQLAAYRKVVNQMTGQEVAAAIYSTAQGQFLRYEAKELETEWTRLKALPAKELLQELDGLRGRLSTRARRE